ncbi:SH2 domain-containing adapter protein D-like [Conger conger]|uniref:SH2 domain-containing adapter protein D-like n=1 Tax=Conger conger TaxID=82655 RepID=UPI002A5AF948|nr:SH2 domain-containing adapter protein D-like [Conger conger]XP_061100064.1 SH2 domain-containing adapter protein D-like [Conger conger]XP_061100065.1 SH2 domain-containing adapter protein D-like [Conger conger]XP_061100066.1 SH2 domain-containing adapter protein D-like [Conger conger]XP_061100067.1 SH2 domain-containing adapter protein D-like [Conger conger]
MAKWLKDYLSFGSRRAPPQPPKPDYTESEILKAYRIQKSLDFEDPYENSENRNGTVMSDAPFGSPHKSGTLDLKSPKHRLIKVESHDLGRSKILLSAVSFEEPDPVVPSAPDAGDLDYSDPFDARPDPRPAPEPEPAPQESNGYMEPYEAQRLLTQLQRGSGSSRSGGGVQLYDTPYEERARAKGRARGAGPADDGRESRLPQDDERPADEYDQPWEWKKEHISKALAVQFDGTDWDRSANQTERARPPRTNPLAGGGAKYRKASDMHGILGERVDPALPLEKQVWYHGALTRSEAESLLTLCKECSYLVRHSQSCRTDYSLSLRSCQGFMHMKFSVSREGNYILGQNSPPFHTIPEGIHYYTTHKLPIRGAEHLSLLFPVVVQTL